MSDEHARPRLAAEISAFAALAAARARRPVGAAVDPEPEIAFLERKAALFVRIAEENPDDALRHQVAAGARRQLAAARARHGVVGGEW